MTRAADALTARELRALNKRLARQGVRICRSHRGDPLPLTEDYFYRRGDGSFYAECKHCSNQRTVTASLHRYRTDADYAERCREAGRERYARFQPQRLLSAADYRQTHRDEYRAAGRVYYAEVARWRRNGVLPTPPGLAVVVYEAARERLRLWDGAGWLAVSYLCTVADWRAAARHRQIAVVCERRGGGALTVLAKFEGMEASI